LFALVSLALLPLAGSLITLTDCSGPANRRMPRWQSRTIEDILERSAGPIGPPTIPGLTRETRPRGSVIAASRRREGTVLLIIYYLAFVIAGDFGAYLLGLFVEYEWGTYPSLLVFLVLYFLVLWVSWLLAVWVSRPTTA
jgi:hypothetical protein